MNIVEMQVQTQACYLILVIYLIVTDLSHKHKLMAIAEIR
ncbi:hypothetical protein KS4_35400 [Poriferisphaera corsica]|uniref:Uncharacterized protein n=1 Tax=Poriferisphaera corsica TaxID=2528020 RepID=A0A517YZ18_9BACT|nr:hypothetical protein KS4_35400 [Poriferisphaera corsica]